MKERQTFVNSAAVSGAHSPYFLRQSEASDSQNHTGKARSRHALVHAKHGRRSGLSESHGAAHLAQARAQTTSDENLQSVHRPALSKIERPVGDGQTSLCSLEPARYDIDKLAHWCESQAVTPSDEPNILDLPRNRAAPGLGDILPVDAAEQGSPRAHPTMPQMRSGRCSPHGALRIHRMGVPNFWPRSVPVPELSLPVF